MVQQQIMAISSNSQLPDSTPVTQDSTANQANPLNIAAVQGASHHLTALSVAISGAQVGSTPLNVVIKDGTTVVWKEIIPASTPIGTALSRAFTNPLMGTKGNAMSIAVDAGGSNCVTTINAAYYDL